jgi:hypothetical protein
MEIPRMAERWMLAEHYQMQKTGLAVTNSVLFRSFQQHSSQLVHSSYSRVRGKKTDPAMKSSLPVLNFQQRSMAQVH